MRRYRRVEYAELIGKIALCGRKSVEAGSGKGIDIVVCV
jgi:hypothetical protein